MTQSTFAGSDLPVRIKRLRKRLRLSQEQFEAIFIVTFSIVNRWESGKSVPSPLAKKQMELLYHEIKKKTGDE